MFVVKIFFFDILCPLNFFFGYFVSLFYEPVGSKNTRILRILLVPKRKQTYFVTEMFWLLTFDEMYVRGTHGHAFMQDWS